LVDSAVPLEAVEGFETCLVVEARPGEAAERRFLASATRPVPAGRAVVEAGRVVGTAPVDDILLEVLVLGGTVLVLVVGLLVVEVAEEAVVGVLVVLEGDVVPELGTADVRRVVVVAAAGFRLSSSDTEGWDL
jgi:hypothetical protein